jgi:transcriptional regulator with XRE-family HTH domain
MQAIFSQLLYASDMTEVASRLRALREKAGISQRELARQIGQDQSNVRFWETTGKIPRSDVLIPIAKVLGVTVEEILGQPKPKRAQPAGGRLGQVFEKATKLPRREQAKIAEVVEALVDRQLNGAH